MQTIKAINELNISDKYKSSILEILSSMKNDRHIEDIILFGSCARGEAKKYSDIDSYLHKKCY